MKILLLVSVIGLLITFCLRANAAANISVGDLAPDFSLLNQHGQTIILSDFHGKWVVLYFYPKDDTPGCTKEACSFRDDISAFEKLGVNVLGISIDNQESHATFASKYKLPFSLLSDSDGKTAEAYGALSNLVLIKLAKRHTYIIDPQGKVAKIYTNVKPNEHSKQLLDDLNKLL